MENITLGFGVYHPNMDPKLITDHLKLVPSVSQRHGDEMYTPNGARLNRKYVFTRWTHIIEIASPKDVHGSELSSLIDYLYTYKNFLCEINSGGGSCSVSLFLTDPDHFVFTIPITTMEKMTQLEICFGLEIFR